MVERIDNQDAQAAGAHCGRCAAALEAISDAGGRSPAMRGWRLAVACALGFLLPIGLCLAGALLGGSLGGPAGGQAARFAMAGLGLAAGAVLASLALRRLGPAWMEAGR